MTDSHEQRDDATRFSPPPLPDVDSPPPEDVIEGVPSPEEIIKQAQSAEEIVRQQPDVDELLRRRS
jgi:hypothetical protein